MKDYSRQIISIIESNFKTNLSSAKEKRGVNELPEWALTVRQLDSLIKNEVAGLESEIVSLTEQLNECDSLIIDSRRKDQKQVPYSDKRYKVKRVSYYKSNR